MFEKIIVPLDGSKLAEQIVPYAARLAAALGASLELLHVIDPSTIGEPPDHDRHAPNVDQLLDQRKEWAQTYLRDIAMHLDTDGTRVEIRVAVGSPERVIAGAARPEGQDLVAMATHGRLGLPRLVLGSVAEKVLHHGNAPLLLCRPAAGAGSSSRPPRSVVVPLDGSGLAERALPAASFIARQVQAKVLLIRVTPANTAGEPVLQEMRPDKYRMVTQGEANAKVYLKSQVHALRVSKTDADSLLTSGDPAAEIIRITRGIPDGLVVMSTHGRSGMARMVLGSVADRVVRESGTPVLLVRAT
jgi:nucleotide-binding universal stress UspA family protein